MGSIIDYFSCQPRCTVVSAGDNNGWAQNFADIMEPFTWNRLCIIGHSFAGIPILEYIAANPGKVDYAGLIDPVSCRPFVASWPAPTPMPSYNCFQRSEFGVEVKLDITGLPDPIIVPGNHNDLPHNSWLIAELDRGVFGVNGTNEKNTPAVSPAPTT